jgi:hypothetical protein
MATKSLATAPPWTPNTSLLDMPNEVLREILLAVDEKFSRTLWSVCLTCKQLRAIVEEFCEPEYNVRGTIIEDPFALMERILAQPSLRYNIRAARMEFNYDTKHTEEEVDVLITSLGLDSLKNALWNSYAHGPTRDDEGLVWLAALLPRLEIVEVSSTTSNSNGGWSQLITLLDDAEFGNILSSHGFRYLSSLTLRYPPPFTNNPHHTRFYNNLYVGVLQLSNLKRLVLDNVMFDQEGWPSVYEGLSSVEELHIKEYQEILMYPEYADEWRTFKGLKILHLHVEAPFLFYEKDYYNPPQYVRCLQSQAHSLENLQLHSNEKYCTSDGTLIELSHHRRGQPSLKQFEKLKSLALTDMALIGVSTTGPTHWHQSFEETLDHLADMFPSTLKVFTHLVWDGPSRFATSVPLQQQMSHLWENVWKASIDDRFPNLKTVMVRRYGLAGVADGSKVIWRRKT